MSVRATRSVSARADPLLGRVGARAAGSEHHGRDAGGGDEGRVGPVARADDAAARRPPSRHAASTNGSALGVDLEGLAHEHRPVLPPQARVGGAAAVEQRVELAPRRPGRGLAGERAPLEPDDAARRIGGQLRAALDQRGVDRAAAQQRVRAVAERRVELAQRGEDRARS